MRKKGFTTGSTTYTCRSCGRLTRDTGRDGADIELCWQCYEIAGIENSVQDGEPVENIRAEVLALADQVRAGGGVPDIEFLASTD